MRTTYSRLRLKGCCSSCLGRFREVALYWPEETGRVVVVLKVSSLYCDYHSWTLHGLCRVFHSGSMFLVFFWSLLCL